MTEYRCIYSIDTVYTHLYTVQGLFEVKLEVCTTRDTPHGPLRRRPFDWVQHGATGLPTVTRRRALPVRIPRAAGASARIAPDKDAGPRFPPGNGTRKAPPPSGIRVRAVLPSGFRARAASGGDSSRRAAAAGSPRQGSASRGRPPRASLPTRTRGRGFLTPGGPERARWRQESAVAGLRRRVSGRSPGWNGYFSR